METCSAFRSMNRETPSTSQFNPRKILHLQKKKKKKNTARLETCRKWLLSVTSFACVWHMRTPRQQMTGALVTWVSCVHTTEELRYGLYRFDLNFPTWLVEIRDSLLHPFWHLVYSCPYSICLLSTAPTFNIYWLQIMGIFNERGDLSMHGGKLSNSINTCSFFRCTATME